MALTIDNQLQERTGAVDSAASVNVTLDTATTAGTTVVVAVLGGLSFPIPSGWADGASEFALGPTGSEMYLRILYRGPTEGLAGGETSWTFTQTTSTSTSWLWWVAEYTGLAAAPNVSQTFLKDDTGLGSTVPFWSPPQLGPTDYLDTLNVSFAAYRGSVQTAANIADVRLRTSVDSAGRTLTLDTVAQLHTALGSAPNFAAGVFRGFSGNDVANNSYLTTLAAEIPAAGGFITNDEIVNVGVMLASADSPLLDPIVLGTGFEYGTHHGISGGVAGSKMADIVAGTHGTNYLIQAGSTKAGTGSYGLRIVQAASIARVGWDTNSLGTGLTQAVCGFHVRPVSATTNPCVLAEVNPASGTTVQVVYNTTTSKVGVRFGAGTVAYQSGTTTINTDYPWVDLLVSGMATTGRAVSWQIEQSGVMVAQTAPTALTGQATTTWLSFTCGSATSQTMTADYDNVCLSNALADYPLRRHKVVLVGVDTVAGADVSGVSSGANLITANVAGAAISVATGQTSITDTLDEVPPDFSATADGFCFNTATPAGTIAVPMGTYTANTITERIDAVRVCIPMWKAASQASVISIAGNNGTSTTLGSGFNPGQSNTTTGSATAPAWFVENWPDSNGWSQTKLDAAKISFTSADGSPALGPLAIYLEVAVNTDYALTPTPSPPVAPLVGGPGVQSTVERSQPGYF